VETSIYFGKLHCQVHQPDRELPNIATFHPHPTAIIWENRKKEQKCLVD
jgi:hypothetical protein